MVAEPSSFLGKIQIFKFKESLKQRMVEIIIRAYKDERKDIFRTASKRLISLVKNIDEEKERSSPRFLKFKHPIEILFKSLELKVDSLEHYYRVCSYVTDNVDIEDEEPIPEELLVEHIGYQLPVQDKRWMTKFNKNLISTPFRSYLIQKRGRGKTVDLIVESVSNLNEDIKDNSLIIQASLEDDLWDEIINAWQRDITTGPHRLVQIIRKMGANYYLNISLQQKSIFGQLTSSKWESNEPITKFVTKFSRIINRAEELKVLLNFADRSLLFKSKITDGREDNNFVFNCIQLIEKIDMENETFTTYMNAFSEHVFTKYTNGVIKTNTTMFAGFTEADKLTVTTKVNEKLNESECYECKESWPHPEGTKCPASTHRCSHCNKKGHKEICCFEKHGFPSRSAKRVQKRKEPAKETNQKSKTRKVEPEDHFAGSVTVISDFQPFCGSTTNTNLKEYENREYENVFVAGLDTCCNCFIFTDKKFFITLHEKEQNIQFNENGTKAKGFGVAKFKLNHPESPVFTVTAYYSPNGRKNLLCNFTMYAYGLKIDHDPRNPTVTFNSGRHQVPILQQSEVSMVEIEPFSSTPECNLSLTDNKNHRRYMHLSSHLLKLTSLNKHICDEKCHTCIMTKNFKTKIKTDKRLKRRPKFPGDICHFDLLIPPAKFTKKKDDTSSTMVLTDRYSRQTFISHMNNTNTVSCIEALQSILTRSRMKPSLFITDGQLGFVSKEFKRYIYSRGISIDIAPPKRHGEFNSYSERHIRTLKAMATSALFDAQLSSRFWEFAVTYAVNVKNNVYHSGLERSSSLRVLW